MIKSKMDEINSMDIMCATEVEEFFYKDTDEPVEEGEPVGLDIDSPFEVEFVLFSNIYWNPNKYDYE
jgi:hypothetical protein|tara:strand:+ start:274 stop:474 length:201 start_codon:yes stop_codon:yes gene_type:complete